MLTSHVWHLLLCYIVRLLYCSMIRWRFECGEAVWDIQSSDSISGAGIGWRVVKVRKFSSTATTHPTTHPFCPFIHLLSVFQCPLISYVLIVPRMCPLSQVFLTDAVFLIKCPTSPQDHDDKLFFQENAPWWIMCNDNIFSFEDRSEMDSVSVGREWDRGKWRKRFQVAIACHLFFPVELFSRAEGTKIFTNKYTPLCFSLNIYFYFLVHVWANCLSFKVYLSYRDPF